MDALLAHRDGSIDEQYKIHITPHEKRDWVIDGGDKVKVFETDAGRVGILICYDSEFPELGRMMAEQDVQIIFVPFWTDTKNGYQRVRLCSQARAIETNAMLLLAAVLETFQGWIMSTFNMLSRRFSPLLISIFHTMQRSQRQALTLK